jgi:hypothetical protein
MSSSLPVVVLVLIGIVLVGLGMFAAGSIELTALGVASVAFAGVLQVLSERRT